MHCRHESGKGSTTKSRSSTAAECFTGVHSRAHSLGVSFTPLQRASTIHTPHWRNGMHPHCPSRLPFPPAHTPRPPTCCGCWTVQCPASSWQGGPLADRAARARRVWRQGLQTLQAATAASAALWGEVQGGEGWAQGWNWLEG